MIPITQETEKIYQEYEICKRIIEEKDLSYKALTSQFELLAEKLISKNEETESIEKENSILESQLIIANEEIERLNSIIRTLQKRK